MNFDVDREIILHYHSERLSKYGQNVRSLWGSTESQRIRFKILAEMGDFNNKSVLDVGCGFGDFYTFLREQNIHPAKYCGIDISENYVKNAIKRIEQLKQYKPKKQTGLDRAEMLELKRLYVDVGISARELFESKKLLGIFAGQFAVRINNGKKYSENVIRNALSEIIS